MNLQEIPWDFPRQSGDPQTWTCLRKHTYRLSKLLFPLFVISSRPSSITMTFVSITNLCFSYLENMLYCFVVACTNINKCRVHVYTLELAVSCVCDTYRELLCICSSVITIIYICATTTPYRPLISAVTSVPHTRRESVFLPHSCSPPF